MCWYIFSVIALDTRTAKEKYRQKKRRQKLGIVMIVFTFVL